MAALFPDVDFQNLKQEDLEDAISQYIWLNPPKSYSIEPRKGLCIVPKQKTDFWYKPYHIPPAARSSGHALLYHVPTTIQAWECNTAFSLSPCVQYDQAGLMVYVDDTHWIKAGIEFENGAPQMSCVVTNNQSDWNYLLWPDATDVKVRVLFQRYDTVCECKVEYEQNGVWTLLREAPLSLPNGCDTVVSVGLMCCAPKKEGEAGMNATFSYVKFKQY